MMHPHTKLGFVNDVVGMGIFATQFIPKGTIIWILDSLDQHLKFSYVESLDPVRQQEVIRYGYRNRCGDYVLCWDLGRFMNHSNNPNVVDIYPGEQITCDYACLNLEEPFHCLPEAGSDRNIIYPDDMVRFADRYDQIAQDSMRYFSKVEQPLAHLIDPQYLEQVSAAIAGELVPASVRTLFCPMPNTQQSSLALV
jgi:uncharacterized protein